MKRPHILLVNDDGIGSQGLFHLWEGLRDFASLTIVAPSQEQSGVGSSISLHKPLQIQEVKWTESKAYCVSGTPADCVKMAMNVILKEPPDLIVSGINRGSNSGRNVLYSGTIGAVVEGVFRGIPGMAISSEEDFSSGLVYAKKYVANMARYLLENPLPQGTLLNVNVPVSDVKGIRMARQGKTYWLEDLWHQEGEGYWLRGKIDAHQEHDESDVALLEQGYITAVPIYVNELTHHAEFEARRSHFNAIQFF